LARSTAREIAFCLLFEKTYTISTPPENYGELFEDLIPDQNDLAYIELVLQQAQLHADQIDAVITQFSRNWKISRIPRADLSVLRLAICEINYLNDVPAVVAVNEAVELAKKFCADESPSFINGILGAYIKQL
jgi:N utilization substance protein B